MKAVAVVAVDAAGIPAPYIVLDPANKRKSVFFCGKSEYIIFVCQRFFVTHLVSFLLTDCADFCLIFVGYLFLT